MADAPKFDEIYKLALENSKLVQKYGRDEEILLARKARGGLRVIGRILEKPVVVDGKMLGIFHVIVTDLGSLDYVSKLAESIEKNTGVNSEVTIDLRRKKFRKTE
ncbi:hypothetical protein A3B18_03025 [Candidatus Giovannonibacteria bacterium RIFCSPLOWO2_01_FULL_46_13]|uniref:Uncharacterized protein n=1 Tax=Candidatus Giovannonibacteria bacterium RIFCSPLOWO2_01_FULL_46_13 TaxID=1798352 RepID=A0A1F5X319_9BACT|nr:MAG: hypothetical protein A3B18_03025 [Candidatus Giovannonibacteria bacterium RIFCSPLOWO2_01_FULL_46_13]